MGGGRGEDSKEGRRWVRQEVVRWVNVMMVGHGPQVQMKILPSSDEWWGREEYNSDGAADSGGGLRAVL